MVITDLGGLIFRALHIFPNIAFQKMSLAALSVGDTRKV